MSKKGKSAKFQTVNTCRGRIHPSFTELDERTVKVHIIGLPYLWAIKKILEWAPNLQKLQVVPTVRHRLGTRASAALQERDVEVIAGWYKPRRSWLAGERRIYSNKLGRRRLALFANLTPEQHRLWRELVEMGFEEAEMVIAHLGLFGHRQRPLKKIVELTGQSQTAVLYKINSVIRYLDPGFPTSKAAIRHAAGIKQRVQQLRVRQQMNPAKLEHLSVRMPRVHKFLVDRFGLKDGVSKSYATVGQRHGGLKAQTVRVIVKRGLEFLATPQGVCRKTTTLK